MKYTVYFIATLLLLFGSTPDNQNQNTQQDKNITDGNEHQELHPPLRIVQD